MAQKPSDKNTKISQFIPTDVFLPQHRDPLPCVAVVFKNSLLGLANFLSRKIAPFCTILIFSYPPFRLGFHHPKTEKRRGGTKRTMIHALMSAGVTPFRTMFLFRTKPVFRFQCGGMSSDLLCVRVLNSPVPTGLIHFKIFIIDGPTFPRLRVSGSLQKNPGGTRGMFLINILASAQSKVFASNLTGSVQANQC